MYIYIHINVVYCIYIYIYIYGLYNANYGFTSIGVLIYPPFLEFHPCFLRVALGTINYLLANWLHR